jgi:bacterioferritin-associated ferredoxin
MIHCVCNNINTAKVDHAAACGAACAKEVQAFCGSKFNCGQCRASINGRLAVVNSQEKLEVAAE